MNALQAVNGQLAWLELPSVPLSTGQVRVRVAAAGINRADLLQRAGLYPPPAGVTTTLGLECSGVVVETSGNTRWQVGQKVCALLAGGGLAEEVVVDERHLLPVPPGLTLLEAAAAPEVYATAWLNLFELGKAAQGEKVLIHAGASGVGSAAILLCKALGNPCWVTVGSAQRLAYCQALGAQDGALRGESLEALNQWAPFDLILDPVGGAYAALSLQWLAQDGRWINIGLLGGRMAELDLAQLLGKRISLIGSTLRNRSDDFKAQLLAHLVERVWPLFTTRQLSAQLAQSFAADQVEQAFAALASNQVMGKLVVRVDERLCAID